MRKMVKDKAEQHGLYFGFILILILLSVLFFTAGCRRPDGGAGITQETEDWKWEFRIQILCPWGEGGGADTTLQAFRTAFMEVNQVPVEIVRKSGSGGIAGTQYAMTYPADGYFYLLGTQSLLLQQVTGETDYDVYGTIQPLCRLVHDCNFFVVRADSAYKSYEDIRRAAEKRPGELTCGMMTLMGVDNACLEEAFGDLIQPRQYQDGASMLEEILAGGMDLAICGPSEFSEALQNGQLRILFSCTEEPIRIRGYEEEIPSAGELGLSCFYGPGRGIFYEKGTPEGAIRAFEEEAEKAVQSDYFQAFLREQSLDLRPGWLCREDYRKAWEEEYLAFTELFGGDRDG